MDCETEHISDAESPYFYWKEYPQRDTEFVRWYPCAVDRLRAGQIWRRNPLVVYVHVPFCNNLCHSCLYNKTHTSQPIVTAYVEAVKKEISDYAARHHVRDATIIAAYVGGGTPTALSTHQLQGLLERLRCELSFENDAPITIETTPREMNPPMAAMLGACGVNRVSIGVQSFDPVLLRRIGRSHTPEQARAAIAQVRAAGIREINVDLMYGLPGQTMQQSQFDIDQLVSLGVNSVSLYFYIVLPSSTLFTRLAQGVVPACPPADISDQMYFRAVEALLSRGYVATTPSDFGWDGGAGRASREYPWVKAFELGPPGYRGVMASSFPPTRYLGHVWYDCGEILAVGAGAYGYLKDYTYFNEPDIGRYIDQVERGELPVVMGSPVPPQERMARNMSLAVKLLRISRADFQQRHGVDLAVVFADALRRLEDQGLVRLTETMLEVTYPKGWYYIDNISKAFFTPANRRMPQPSPTNTVLLRFLKGDLDQREPVHANHV